MKKMRNYHRTAALLGAQPKNYAHPKHRIGVPRLPWKVALPLALVIIIALWLWLDNRWYLMGENLQVVGASTTGLAREVALASDLLGWHGFLLRPKAATEAITDNVPGIIYAETTCNRFPAACSIQVVERKPALVWTTDSAIYWVDHKGKLFPAQNERLDLPLVKGPLPDAEQDVISVDILQGIEALMSLDISAQMLEYHPKRGLIWVDSEGRRVAFGIGANMEARWQMYQALIAHLDTKGIFPSVVDVRFVEGPTYALERSW